MIDVISMEDRDKVVDGIVGEIINGNKEIGIKIQRISQYDKNGSGSVKGVEFLSFYAVKESQPVFRGGELYSAAKRLTKVAEIDLKSLDRITVCLKNGFDDLGSPIPEVRFFNINLSKEIMYERNLRVIIRKINSLCKKVRAEAVFELSERLDDEKDYDKVCDLTKMIKGIQFALDDTFCQDKLFIRVPVIYEMEFDDNIRFIKLDCKFFWLLTDTSRFPNTLKKIIERYHGRLIIEGVKDELCLAVLDFALDDVGKRGLKLLIQGDLAPVSRVTNPDIG